MRPAAALAVTIGTIAVIGAGAIPRARAQDASAWDTELHAATRLIAGAAVRSADAAWLRAGIEIRLDPGWKTYWRYPGDSGVPPTLDFAGSANVKSVTALWPAPERFADGAGGHSIGYRGDTVLPLRIVADDATKPSALHLKVVFAICSTLCVPAEANLALVLSGKVGVEEATLLAAEARVPRRVPLGADSAGDGGLAVRSVHRESVGGHQRVVVEVVAPEGAPVDLFVEGPTSDWALPLPEPSRPVPTSAPAMREFTFNLEGEPPGAQVDGAIFTFTAVSPAGAIEVKTRLD